VTLDLEESPEEVEGGTTAPWTTLGSCEIHEEIGRGGMGVVYRARQRDLDRPVAVKALLRAGFASETQRARFRREAEAVARLRHPSIVAIHEIGENEGVPWFSMDLIEGESLEEAIREHPLPDRDAAICLREIALAVAHAHERSILHRDLKPSNILIDTSGRPYVTDFGIAGRLDADAESGNGSLTETGQSLGSPGYAAPELVQGLVADVRTDVYGLGAILYHTLTGRPPHQGPTLESILHQVCDSDPVAPSRLNPSIARDLETICLKCLRKSPADRYGSANEVAEDLDRFLAGSPIRARPVGPLEVTWRWCRRRPATASLLFSVVFLLVAIAVGALAIAKHREDLATRAALIADGRVHLTRGFTSSRASALEAFWKASQIRHSPELRYDTIAALALPDWTPLQAESTGENPDILPKEEPSGDGTRAVRFDDGAIVVTDLATGSVVSKLAQFPNGSLVRLDETGSRLAIVSPGESTLTVVSLPRGERLFTCSHPEPITSVDWSQNLIATGCGNRFVYVWTDEGELCHRLIGHESPDPVVRFRPGGQELASLATERTVILWHAARGVRLLSETSTTNNRPPPVWTPDGATLRYQSNTGGEVRGLTLSLPKSMRLFCPPQEEPGPENIQTMDISPEGDLLSTADDGVCRVWEVATGRVIAVIPKGEREWCVTRFSPDGETLWISGWDRGCVARTIIREAGRSPRLGPPGEPLFGSGCLLQAISRDGKRFVLSDNGEGRFVVAGLESGIEAELPHPAVLSAAISPDSTLVATSSYATHSARVWSVPSGKMLRELKAPGMVGSLHFSSDGRFLTLRASDGALRFRTDDWEPDPTFQSSAKLDGAVFTADDTWVASYSGDDILLLDPNTLAERLRLPSPPAAGWLGNAQIAFSADSKKLAIRAATGTIILWDLARLRQELAGLGMEW